MRDLFTQIEFFREALSFTSQSSGFPERLIEKDYVCTLLLEVLTAAHDELVFKGGTCLAKVYADFYRMSEDLDFVIPMPVDASRSKKSAQAKSLKDIIGALPEQFPFVRVVEPLRKLVLHFCRVLARPIRMGRVFQPTSRHTLPTIAHRVIQHVDHEDPIGSTR